MEDGAALADGAVVLHMSMAYAILGDTDDRTSACETFSQWPQSSGPHPVEFELPGNEAIMHRDGERLVIEPVRKRGLVALLKTMKPIESGIPEIDDPLLKPEQVF